MDAVAESNLDGSRETARDSRAAFPGPDRMRAGFTSEAIETEHDAEDRRAGRRIKCPMLVLWSGHGPLNTWYTDVGGPLALWRLWADDVGGGPVEAGHFFPEEIPDRTAQELSDFFARS